MWRPWRWRRRAASEQAGSIGFAVTLSLAADQEVTVHWATQAVGNTATEGQDYSGGSGTLSFPAGSTAAQTSTVVVHNDELDEPDEQFTVTLSNPVHAVLAGGGATVSATGTIADDDALPVLSIEDSSLTEGSGDGSMRFTVRLEPASARTVTVDYATSDGTATARRGLHAGDRHTDLRCRQHDPHDCGADRGRPERRRHRDIHRHPEQPELCGNWTSHWQPARLPMTTTHRPSSWRPCK